MSPPRLITEQVDADIMKKHGKHRLKVRIFLLKMVSSCVSHAFVDWEVDVDTIALRCGNTTTAPLFYNIIMCVRVIACTCCCCRLADESLICSFLICKLSYIVNMELACFLKSNSRKVSRNLPLPIDLLVHFYLYFKKMLLIIRRSIACVSRPNQSAHQNKIF